MCSRSTPTPTAQVLFRVNPSGQPVGFSGRGRGGIVWGGAADRRQVYYGMGAAGLGAVQSPDGKTAWVFTAPVRAAAASRLSARRRRRSRAWCSRVPAMAGCSPCRRPTASSSGSSTPRRTSTPSNKVPARGGADRHRGRGRRGRHGLHRVRLRDQQRRVGRQRAAGLRCGVARLSKERSGCCDPRRFQRPPSVRVPDSSAGRRIRTARCRFPSAGSTWR